MEAQDELWASVARPVRLRIGLERLWTLGDDVVDVTIKSVPSKGEAGEWTVSARFAGPDTEAVVMAHVAKIVSRFMGATAPPKPSLRGVTGVQPHLPATPY